ncbi:2'-5' RNA ligase family protein [Deinococcus hopiensis]|uniref:2'-5' RNA ligase family protein n=1 Tax=Deinococcus hopiensis TaxID=309885 RepID=UPI003CCC392F
MFLNVERGNDELVALHDMLYSHLFPEYLNPEYTFVPHITLGRVPDRTARLSALNFARAICCPLEVRANRLTLYSREETGGKRGSMHRSGLENTEHWTNRVTAVFQ